MDVGAIREAVPAAVGAAIPSLNCLGYLPDAIPEPCFYSGEVEIDFDRAFGRGLDEIELTCRLLVARSDDLSGQARLDSYMAGSGPLSVKAAIDAARGAPGEAALGGLCDDLHLRRVQGHRLYQVGNVMYYGAEFIIRIIGKGG